MLKVYFANSLFSEADRDFNSKVMKEIRDKLGEKLKIYLPQENEAINDKRNFAGSKEIAIGDNENLKNSDILIAVLDGEVIDPGVACEIGYAAATNKLIIGLTTDSRKYYYGENPNKRDSVINVLENQYHYKNLYVIGNIKINGGVVSSVDELINFLGENINED